MEALSDSIFSNKQNPIKKNMGWLDRAFRLIVAILIFVLFYNSHVSITSVEGIIFLFLAILFIITAFKGNSLLYTLFGLSTTPKDK